MQSTEIYLRVSPVAKLEMLAANVPPGIKKGAFDGARDSLLVRQRLPHTPEAPLLANCRGGHQAYSGNGLSRGLHSLFRAAGVFTATGDPPRPHDLRHSHALHVLLKWCRAGIDLQAKLPVLAASMGHVWIASTAYYIRFVEPLAEAAAERFARHARPVLGPARSVERTPNLRPSARLQPCRRCLPRFRPFPQLPAHGPHDRPTTPARGAKGLRRVGHWRAHP